MYPPLVEQAYYAMLKAGMGVPRKQVFEKLIEMGMLTADGQPTKQALEQGLIGKATDTDLIGRFKAENPLFTSLKDEHFKVENGEVVIDKSGVQKAAEIVLDDPTASDEAKVGAIKLLNETNYKGGGSNDGE